LVGVFLLWVAAYALGATPSARARGAVGFVPSTAMGAALMVSPAGRGTRTGPGWRSAALGELRVRAARGDPTLVDGWLAGRLLFAGARLTPTGTLTDQGAMRGRLFHVMVNGALERGAAYGFERRWAEGVVWFEATPRVRIAPGAPVWAEVRVRRLVSGAYRVQVGGEWFDTRATDRGVMGPNPGPGMRPGERRASETGDRVLDLGPGVFGVRQARGLNAVVVRLGDAAMHEGPEAVSVPLRVLTEAGEGFAERASRVLMVEHRVEAGARPVRAATEVVRAELQRALEAVVYAGSPVPGGPLSIDIVLADVAWLDADVTVGGAAELGYWADGTDGAERAWVAMARLDQGWWRVIAPMGPLSKGDDWWFRMGELLLPAPWGVMPSMAWVGEARDDFASDEPVMLRIGVGGNAAAYADLGAERVFDGVLQLETDLTVGRLNRYRATGRSLRD
tara:strand:+ start:932 stop:2281 length:1350 start_codon:yes stop_codon:yes gene_type:complete